MARSHQVNPATLKDNTDPSKIDPKNFQELLDILETTKSPDEGKRIIANFHRQRPWLRVAIRAEAVRELYGGKRPTPDDGILGWVPKIEEQLAHADTTDDDIEVSLADWNANVAPEVAEKLHLRMRLRYDRSSREDANDRSALHEEPCQPKQLQIAEARGGVTPLSGNSEPSTAINSRSRAPIWPVLIAPLVAFVYYFSAKTPFIIDVGGFSSNDTIEAQWGSYSVYRIVMEVCSIAIATFVAAGLARGRERAGGIISGITISLWFASFYLIEGLSDLNWSDIVLEGLIIIGAPLIGLIAAVGAHEMNRVLPIGFAGLNRFHLIWLWAVVFFYVGGLIGPAINLFKRHFGGLDLIAGFALGVPLGALGILVWIIPGYYGYALLSGLKGHKYQPITHSILGAALLLLPASIFFLIGFIGAATNEQ